MSTAEINFIMLRALCKDMEDVYTCRHKDNGFARCKPKYCPVWKGLHTLKRDLDALDNNTRKGREEIILIRQPK